MKDFFCRLFTPWKAGAQFDAPEAFYGFLLGRDKLLGTIRNEKELPKEMRPK